MTKNEAKEILIKDGFDPRYSGKKRCFFITKPRGEMIRDIVGRPVTVKDVKEGRKVSMKEIVNKIVNLIIIVGGIYLAIQQDNLLWLLVWIWVLFI